MDKKAMKFIAVRLGQDQVQLLEDLRHLESKKVGKRVSIRSLVEAALEQFLQKKVA